MKVNNNEIMTVLQVIINFDFNKVRKCMEALGATWKLPKELNSERTNWQPEQMTDRMPTDIEMHSVAYNLLFKAIQEELASITTKGFEARFEWMDEKHTKYDLSLNFVPEDVTISATITGITPIEKPEETKENENDKK